MIFLPKSTNSISIENMDFSKLSEAAMEQFRESVGAFWKDVGEMMDEM